MAVQIAFVFQSPDRTDYLNQRLAGLIGKGIYSGAELTPTGAGLTATRAPFLALGRDGITIWDTEVGTFNYTTGQPNYHCILGKYNPLGTPSTPVVQELVLSEAAYNAHPDKAYLIIVGVVEPAGSVLVAGEIDYTLRDEVGPFGRAQLRGVVDTEGELPTGTPNWNRSGDLYICNDDPAPGGGGLYMWEGTTSSWRLVAAKGAATLDGAYDNNGAGGPPGYGRFIEVDAGAVELLQENTSQRQNDPANAALRIRKIGTTAAGDVGADVVLEKDLDAGGLLIRSHFTSGTYIQVNEPVNVSGSTITCTRGSANWNNAAIHKAHVLLVELTGSSIGNDGLFIALPSGPTTCSIKGLANSSPTLSSETGLTANFFSVRYAIGSANVARLTENDLSSTYAASVEFFGNTPGTGYGRVTYVTPSTLSYVWQIRRTTAGGQSTRVAGFLDGGNLYLRPVAGYIDWYGIDVENSSVFGTIRAVNTGSGVGITGSSVDSYGGFFSSTNNIGLYASTTSGGWNLPAIRAIGNTATGIWSTVTGGYAAVLGSSSGTGGKGVWGELQNAGDTTGYGVYGKHAGNGVGIYGEALGSGAGAGVKGRSSGTGYGILGVAETSGSTGVRGDATHASANAGMYAYSNQSAVPAIIAYHTYTSSAALKVTSGKAEFWGGAYLRDDCSLFALHEGGDNNFYTAVRTADETQPTWQYSYMLDYHGRPCRGNHLTDDFHYTGWSSISSAPPQYVALADTGNGSDVDTNYSDILGDSVRLHIGTSPSSYAYFCGRKGWVARRSDAGGTMQGRFFFRVLLTGGPTTFFVGFTNHQSGLPFDTKRFGVGTGLSFTGYPDGWNFWYRNTVTGNSTQESIQFDDWVSWYWYNIELHVISANEVAILINDGIVQTFTLPGGDTFTSELWAPTAYVGAPVSGGNDYYVDYMDVWHDLALKWAGGYATPMMP